MTLSIGCIGCGNMGGAILGGLAQSGKDIKLYGHTRTMSRLDALEAKGVVKVASAEDMPSRCRYLVLAVKPYQAKDVLAQIRDKLSAGNVLVSICAGLGIATLKEASGGRCPVVRCMPNTPAVVGEGVFAFSFEDPSLAPEQRGEILSAFASLGQCVEVPEARFTAFTSLIGAGPAYLFDLMEGMVQAGVALGFQHRDCRAMVAQLFAGCGRMALQRPDVHLMQLRDDVCSPAGTTIAGVNRMDADGLAGKLAQAVFAANDRGREMEG
ncbi:MAG: pyrroline-5-carboxylate reductase [Desulfovibrio sp.]|nr:pyrroline-5-carboxylate reductase [Desulfovibrio sp.]